MAGIINHNRPLIRKKRKPATPSFLIYAINFSLFIKYKPRGQFVLSKFLSIKNKYPAAIPY